MFSFVLKFHNRPVVFAVDWECSGVFLALCHCNCLSTVKESVPVLQKAARSLDKNHNYAAVTLRRKKPSSLKSTCARDEAMNMFFFLCKSVNKILPDVCYSKIFLMQCIF
jgi:hypothetical protein